MSMIRKIIPVSLYDIPGLEGWLEEQASQGLFPTSLGSWAVFEDRGLPGTRFRLDPFANRAGEEGTLFQTAAVAIGDKVVLVRYTGHGEFSGHLEDIIKMAEGKAS